MNDISSIINNGALTGDLGQSDGPRAERYDRRLSEGVVVVLERLGRRRAEHGEGPGEEGRGGTVGAGRATQRRRAARRVRVPRHRAHLPRVRGRRCLAQPANHYYYFSFFDRRRGEVFLVFFNFSNLQEFSGVISDTDAPHFHDDFRMGRHERVTDAIHQNAK